ncbi:HAD family hydrolase [Promicromonospora citrea]|uniref:Hydrolase n=1 Tax=Promicromonospora citrea TaxID=43677 RepID=A0A8H9GGV4_9MICO|nr:HAD-IA family hydrolase [Promicromonospora citrea]NNH53354.1 HAD family hydrolase [Promicromonospora citrea]GGM20192.1 hydrolase [Promicromonospora citrea]
MSRAAELLNAAQAVLLDFDGPVTPLMPAPANLEAADSARSPLRARGVILGSDIGTTSDHLAVLRWTAENAPEALPEVEKRCDEAEIASVRQAKPTRGAAELLVACHRTGKPVVIVSNNTERAIRAYLDRWLLSPYVTAVVGRPIGRPDLMKPNTHTVDQALHLLGVDAEQAVFIGDSVSDVEVSQRVGTRCIGYAKTPRRGTELRVAGADAVTDDMSTFQ